MTLFLYKNYILSALIISIFGYALYKSIASRCNFIANPNFRSLHQIPIPTGAGVVFSSICIACFFLEYTIGEVDKSFYLILLIGGVFSVIIGFVDDIVGLSPSKKLLAQICLSGLSIFCLDGGSILNIPFFPAWINAVICWVGLLWLINLYNFIDGIDGLAAGGGLFFCISAMVLIFLSQHIQGETFLPLALVGTCLATFLLFNFPKASLFMGDSGSIFLGFFFGVIIVYTVNHGAISLFTWLILFGYFAGDTTITTITRIFMVKRWYGAHRSNAYQNIARISGSHVKVLSSIIAYKIFWLFPIALASIFYPDCSAALLLMAYSPVIFFVYCYGPRLSSS
jgi:Fuc2NAc and GlcNAc transferase